MARFYQVSRRAGIVLGGIFTRSAWIMRNNITILGQWMYQPEAVTGMVGLIRSGLLDLDHYAVTEFVLEGANEAVAHAAANAGPFKLTVLRLAA
jgi:alcohol dehydrogenase